MKNFIRYIIDAIENLFYEEVLNEYGSKHDTRSKVMRFVKRYSRNKK